MTEFLILLLTQVTVFSSVTAAVIIAVKQIFKCRIPPGIGMVMWVVLLLRLICPTFPESRISVYNFIPAGREIMYTLTNDIEDDISERESEIKERDNPYVIFTDTDEESDETVVSSEYSSPVTLGEYFVNDIGDEAELKAYNIDKALLGVYAVGVVFSFIVNAYIYLRVKHRILKSSELCIDEDMTRLYFGTSEKLGLRGKRIPTLRYGNAAMLVGCVKSSIIIPRDCDRKEASFVFAHELSHFRYKDNEIIAFSTFVSCLFWYNPLIWIVRKMLRDDVEVLCDSRTIECFSFSASEYARMICRHSMYSPEYAAGCNMSAVGRSLKTRLRSISHEKNDKFLSKATSVLLCAVMIAICLTNPIISQSSEYEQYIKNYSAVTGINKRYLQYSSKVSVSDYLKTVSELLENKISADLRSKIGNGSLERFKRIVYGCEYLENNIKGYVKELKSDDILSVKTCAVIDECIVAILSGGIESDIELSLLPKYISTDDMSSLSEILSADELEDLMMWYNKGVEGAEVSFERYYTSAMMELILDRINDDWSKRKFRDFYTEIEVSELEKVEYSDEILNIGKFVKKESSFYVIDPEITTFEETTLRHILSAAQAGQRSDVYYLKEREDGCTAETAERLFESSGYSVSSMLEGYAEIGEAAYEYLKASDCVILSYADLQKLESRLDGSGYSILECYDRLSDDDGTPTGYYILRDEKEITSALGYLNLMTYTTVNDDTPAILDISEKYIRSAIADVYRLGLIEAEDGVIESRENISLAQSIAYAYRIVTYAVNLH